MFVNSDNYIKYLKLWLITLFSLIVLMVAVGGLTRLTDSGLSITAWELFTGILPPLNISEWNFYFSEYKKIPEYQNINYGMSLNEFKVIFYWEYAHRLLARFVGLFTLVPLLFFSLYFKKTKHYSNKYYWVFFLICLQGFIGWYMVSSGLIENNDVSHFRLSIHLSLDAAAALDWLERENFDNSQCWVSGFSFGSLIAMQLLMRRPEINRFIAISPQPNVYDFSFLSPCPTSGLMIYGKKDELVPLEHITDLDKRLSAQKGIKVDFQAINDANHFFTKTEDVLVKCLDKYIKKESALF